MTISRAFFDASVAMFLSESQDAIIGRLTKHHTQDIVHNQQRAWAYQIDYLKVQLRGWSEGWIFFEFIIPRMGSRADVVLLIQGVVFVLEFKVGSSVVATADLRQVEGYCLDLYHFHAASQARLIVPVLIATNSIVPDSQTRILGIDQFFPSIDLSPTTDLVSHVLQPIALKDSGLGALIHRILKVAHSERLTQELDGPAWASAPYRPTPTIIEAAEALYANHDVHAISRNDAGAENLAITSRYVKDVINSSRKHARKSIVFLTGVPGSGKTLAGLNIATTSTEDDHAVFLSGNGPLVEVLREALARDDHRRTGIRKTDAKRKVASFVQNIHRFRDEALRDPQPPIEHVALFDEAQRAWDQQNTARFMSQKRQQHQWTLSEPEFLIGVMDRHDDWTVIVALVGMGQEINAGEAGLPGWINAIQSSYSGWDVYYSDRLEGEFGPQFRQLENPVVVRESSLHLAVSIRSFRAEQLSEMVHAVVNGEASDAHALKSQMKNRFPIVITRDISKGKAWIRTQTRGTDRSGMIASSGAIRLKPFGITVKQTLDAPVWFLNEPDDVRTSNFLENVGTEFDIQGLELDWTLVAWDADLRYGARGFEHWAFTGTRWHRVRQETTRRFLENAYRVLLTRARQGIVVFVPEGDPTDVTRLPEFYDGTYAYLVRCGFQPIP